MAINTCTSDVFVHHPILFLKSSNRVLTVISCFLLTSFVSAQQQPTLTLSNTGKVFRQGDSLTYFCMIDKPAPDGTFSWNHLRNSTGITSMYNITTHEIIPRITVLEGTLSIRSKYSNLVISEVTPEDSGIIACVYTYGNDGEKTELKVPRDVCIASLPSTPICARTANNMIICKTQVQCPDDGVLKWSDASTKAEHYGEVSRRDGFIQNVLELDQDDGSKTSYQCVLDSTLYPDVHLTCTIDPSEEDQIISLDTIPTISTLNTSRFSHNRYMTVTSHPERTELATEKLIAGVSSPNKVSETVSPLYYTVQGDTNIISENCSQTCEATIIIAIFFALVSGVSMAFNLILYFKHFIKTKPEYTDLRTTTDVNENSV